MNESVKQKLNMISNSEDNTNELYSIFNSFEGEILPIIRINIEAGAYVVRQRINDKDKVFSNVSDLSYPPVHCCYNYGRANLPYHSMFYCCSFSGDKDAPLPRYITLIETSAFIKDTKSVGVQRATCSRWDIIEDLELLALPFSDNYEKTIATIEQIKSEWKKLKCKTNINKDALELVEYMSDEIAKETVENLDYFKIANFIYYLLYINKSTFNSDGIIYPSVAAGGEGFNIVLKPETVDKKLKFSVASLCYLIKNGMKADLYIVNHSTEMAEDGSLSFELQEDFDKQICEGFEFIN